MICTLFHSNPYCQAKTERIEATAAGGALADEDRKDMRMPLADLLSETQTVCFARVIGGRLQIFK